MAFTLTRVFAVQDLLGTEARNSVNLQVTACISMEGSAGATRKDGLQLQSKKRRVPGVVILADDSGARTVEQPLSQSPKGKRSRGKKRR